MLDVTVNEHVVPVPHEFILVAPSKILMIYGVGPTSWFAVAVSVTDVPTAVFVELAERETDHDGVGAGVDAAVVVVVEVVVDAMVKLCMPE